MRKAIKLSLFCLVLSSLLLATDYRFVKIDVPNAIATTAGSINARGDISGRYEDANGVSHGFLLRQGKYIAIDVPGSTSTTVLGINDDGVIVGGYADKQGVDHGFKAVPKDER
jgi:hypothetical protein